MVIAFHALCQKRTMRFQKEQCLPMNFNAFTQGYLFSEQIYYMLSLSKYFAHRIRATITSNRVALYLSERVSSLVRKTIDNRS